MEDGDNLERTDVVRPNRRGAFSRIVRIEGVGRFGTRVVALNSAKDGNFLCGDFCGDRSI